MRSRAWAGCSRGGAGKSITTNCYVNKNQFPVRAAREWCAYYRAVWDVASVALSYRSVRVLISHKLTSRQRTPRIPRVCPFES